MRIKQLFAFCLAAAAFLSAGAEAYAAKTDVSREAGASYCRSGNPFDYSNGVLKKYYGSEEHFEIPDYVTSIGASAFSGCETLRSVTFPHSVTSIGNSAFSGCKNLSSVSFDDSLIDIGQNAFSGCKSLTGITLPDSVRYLGNDTFYGCTGLQKVTVGKGVTDISIGVFTSCESLTEIRLPASLKSIGNFAFQNCTALSEITLPDRVTDIGYRAFNGCRSLKSIVLPPSVKTVDEEAFMGCDVLTGAVLPDALTTLKPKTFAGCPALASVTLPASVTEIAADTFTGCTALASINADPGSSAFCSVDGVLYSKDKTRLVLYPRARQGSFTVPASVTAFSDRAFAECRGLTALELSDTVTDLGSGTFCGCSSLKSFAIPAGTGELKSFPVERDYDEGYVWYNGLFEGCSSLTDIFIPKSVTNIGRRAFSGCTSLKAIDVDADNPSFVSLDGVLCNKEKTSLLFFPNAKSGEYVIPPSITTIGHAAFAGCTKLSSVTVSKAVKIVMPAAFAGCTGLRRLMIKSADTGFSYFDDYDRIFSGCHDLSVDYPGTAQQWNDKQMERCFSGIPNLHVYYIKYIIKITRQPQNQSIILGDRITLSVAAEGSGISYQWYYQKAGQNGWSIWRNRTKPSETVTPNETWNGIRLYCLLSNGDDEIKTDTVTVTVNPRPSITEQPKSLTATCGQTMGISVAAAGTNLRYQWYYQKRGQSSWNIWKGHTHAYESVVPNDTWDGIQLRCEVKDSSGNTAISDTATVTLRFPLKITRQPEDVSARVGENVTFSVSAQGQGLTYQWYYKKKGQTTWNLWKGHTHSKEISPVNATWDSIQFFCVVRDSGGVKASSTAAKVSLIVDTAITRQPEDVSAKAGENVTFSLSAQGQGLIYQWYYKKKGQTSWNLWKGHTHSKETAAANATWDGIQFRCEVRDSSGKSLFSKAATVTLTVDLRITEHPLNREIRLGETVTLSVSAEGKGLSYQWYYKKRGQSSFSKWTNRAHASETVIPNATWDGIQLYCEVTDSGGGKVNSNTAVILVNTV